MRYLPIFFCALLLIGCAKTPTAHHRQHGDADIIPIEDFFRNPTAKQFRISPDGSQIAFLAPYRSRMNIFVQPAEGESKARRLTDVRDRDISGFLWKGNGTIVYGRDRGGDENTHLYAVNSITGKTRPLTPFAETKVRVIDDLRTSSATDILIEMNRRDRRLFDVYRLNVADGTLTLVAENTHNWTNYVADHQGRLRIAEATDGLTTTYYYRPDDAHPFAEIFSVDFRTTIDPILFTPDDRYAYARSNRHRDKEALVVMDMSTGKERKILFRHPEVDVGGIGYSRKRKRLTHVSYTTWKEKRHVFDTRMRALFARLQAHRPEMEVDISSWNDDEDRMVVVYSSDRVPAEYVLYDAQTDRFTKLATALPWLDAEKLAPMKPIAYRSRDGLLIHGYLTLPRGREAKNLPVVVNPHGGPWARDVWGYDGSTQFLANRGYAVLQMNFRGSTGYGRRFWEASFKEWGLKMQNDITDGVHWLIDEGIADSKRIGIYGASYGGYATLAGLTFTPDLYACGVDYVGVSNIFTLLASIPPYWEPARKRFYAMIGNPITDDKLLRAISPVFHAENIRAPLFVAQGANDPRVKKQESDQIVAALRHHDIPVEYLVKRNEGHGFHNEENRLEFFSRMERFLERYLSPTPQQ